MQLLNILRESIKAVPAMKYALAVAGVLAVVALVGAFKISPQTAVFGAVITLVLMVAMVIFARLTVTAPRHFFLPVQIMMWAFLIVTVGAAFLLFTSAFFQWPRGLQELLDPQPASPTVFRSEQIRPLVAAARQQRNARDYGGAWNTIGRALERAPESKEAGDEQLQIAMAWAREMGVREPAASAGTLLSLTECLHVDATRAEGALAADIHAHIGWLNHVRSRVGAGSPAIEEEFKTAVALDPGNPYAHAMWGYWLATQRQPLAGVTGHFQVALESGREREYVQWMRIGSLLVLEASTPDAAFALVRIADEMRRGEEALSPELRRRVYSATYVTLARNDESTLLALLPAADNLATFRWLTEAREVASSGVDSYLLARLTEAAGDLAGAADLYRTLLELDTIFEDRIQAGLARCGQRVVKQNGRKP